MFVKGSIQTVVTLFGGLLIGVIAGDLLFKAIPGSSLTNPSWIHASIAAIPAFAGFLAGGAAWGIRMGKMAGSDERRRMARAGLAGFAPITIVLALLLSLGEPGLVITYGENVPIHRLFMLLFVPTAFLIAGTSAFTIGMGLRNPELARSLFWRIGLAAAVTFLVVNLAMEWSGWVVGAPGAAERATMVTVLGVCCLASAIVAGGTMGKMLTE